MSRPHRASLPSSSPHAPLKLGRLLDTLPERLALARSHELEPHGVLGAALLRRGPTPGRRLGRAAGAGGQAGPDDDTRGLGRHRQDHLRPGGVVRARVAALCRAGANAFVLGPVGVGKTFLATALGHIACRRRVGVHFERADRLLKRLKAARLDANYDAEMRKLIGVELLMIDDFCLQPSTPSRRPTSTRSASKGITAHQRC